MQGRPSVLVYAWGRGDEGQLGVGDESDHLDPTPVSALDGKDIVHICAGEFHTAFLTDEGEVFTSGNNSSGQLGVRGPEKHVVPMRVAALDTHIVTHIACGSTHTVAVTETGALASWGGAEFGQLGFEAGSTVDHVQPRIVKGSRDLHFSRVATGVAHTLALTGSGDVYSFGQGSIGALGHGNLDSCNTPLIVKSLWGLGVIQVACGEYHSVALTADGQIFTWGRGKYGQLGHGTAQNGNFPVAVKALADHHVSQIACGGDHTVAINSDGQVFSWGRGLWGQTGHGTKEDILSPKQVQGLEGKLVVQATAGARHTVVLLDKGEVYGWGDCEQGQLGTSDSDTQLSPKLLLSFEDGKRPLFVVAGGEHTFFVCEQVVEDTPMLESVASDIKQNSPRLKVVDNRHGNGLRPMKIPSLLQLVQNAAASPRCLPVLAHALEDIFSSVKFLAVAFAQPASRNVEEENRTIAGHIRIEGEDVEGPGLDVELIQAIYHGVLQLYNPEMVQKLGDAMFRLFQNMEKYVDTVPESRWTKVLLIGLQSPLIGEKGLGDTVSVRLFAVFRQVSASAERKISQWFRTYPKEIFGGRFVRGILRFISNRENHLASGGDGIPRDIASALKVLLLLYRADDNEDLIPFSEFYSTSISDHASLEDDYLRWSQARYPSKDAPLVAFCQLPFVLTPDAKSKILQIEADIQKNNQFRRSIMAQLLGAVLETPFLVLTIRRSHLIADSLRQLVEHECDFKKPLKVVFEGEAGVDEGGVTKEFFQLLIRELFNVSYGMFVYNEETRRFWFNRNSMETEHEFRLMGNILGLAIYNGVILDIHFPMAVYKKLMRESVSLKDLADLQPQVAKGLKELLEYEGDVEGTFYQSFQVTYEYFGEMKTHDLVEGGGDMPVTNDNRERYVDLYVKYLLEDSIHEQFDAFHDGFYQVCGGPALSLFRHEELELLVCGLPHFDFDALERVTIYQNGYTMDSQIIKWFWEVVKSMSLDEKKQLLFFTTGNDRAPVGGLATLKFIITRNGDDTDRLPTAHTCFNIFMLPNYSSKEKFENRLKLAIANSTGFGLQ